MSHFRHAYVPGGSFFFTLVMERRAPILCTDISRVFLRTAIRECRQRWPFRIDAMVLLDNLFHAILTMPDGDTGYSARWGGIKKEFTKAYHCGFNQGVYPQDWGIMAHRIMEFDDLDTTAME